MDTPPIRTERTQRLFYALALFNLASIVVTLWVTQRIMSNFQDAIAQNREWATRLSAYAELNAVAGQGNAPGNDVFDSKDVAGEARRLDAVLALYQQHLRRSQGELRTLPQGGADASEPRRLMADLEAIDRGMTGMVGEARAIFSFLQRSDKDQAGARMATMDREFARMRDSGQSLERHVREIQMQRLSRQEATARALQHYQVGVSALLLLVVLAVVLFGRSAGAALQRSVEAVAAAEAESRALLARIELRNRDLRLILDHVNQGLLTLSPAGLMSPERSAIVDRWLGPHRDGVSFWEVVQPLAPAFASAFRMNFDELLQNIMPRELLLDQLPRRLSFGNRHLKIEYFAIAESDAADLQHLMLVMTDISELVVQERAEAEQRALLALVQRLLQNREAFKEFYEELRGLLAQAQDEALPLLELRRVIHTIKGNASSYGVTTLTALCHQIEERMLETGGGVSPAERKELKERWERLDGHIGKLLPEGQARGLLLCDHDLDELLEHIWDGASRGALAARVQWLRLQPVEARLARLGDQAQDLARRLGKGAVEVTVDGGGVRIPAERFGAFFSACTHLVRNAVDHGLDTAEERAAANKPPRARLTLLAHLQAGALMLEIGDDGRGIDRERVAQRARALGLLVGDVRDDRVLTELLCHDGLSTKEEASEFSGRGVGLAAVRGECLALGGVMTVRSQPGHGSRFFFCFPRAALHAEPPARESEGRGAALLRVSLTPMRGRVSMAPRPRLGAGPPAGRAPQG